MFLSITLRTLILQSRKLQSILKFLDSCSNFHFIFISLQSSFDIKTDCGLSCCTRIRTSLVNDISVNNYRPRTKLWKANVFTRVCLFTEGVPIWPLPMIQWTSLYNLSPRKADMGPLAPALALPPLDIRHGTPLTLTLPPPIHQTLDP